MLKEKLKKERKKECRKKRLEDVKEEKEGYYESYWQSHRIIVIIKRSELDEPSSIRIVGVGLLFHAKTLGNAWILFFSEKPE